jgi:hypothetical protein
MKLDRKRYLELIDARINNPASLQKALKNRARRTVAGKDGKLMLLAADHTARGIIAAGNNPTAIADRYLLLDKLIRGLAVAGVDGVMASADILEELAWHASEHGMRPLLHFDMHGNKEEGLHIFQSSEYFSWNELYTNLQGLNKATGNNLVIIGAACFGLRSIMPIKLDKPAPFFVLLAPEEEVCVGFSEDNVQPFYRDLFASGSLDAAYSRHLSDEFKYFHCEKMLFIVVAKYIRAGCKGKSAQERREQLLTDVFSQGMEKTEANLSSVRKKIKEGLKPDQSLLDRYAKIFLAGRTCSFNMQQLLEFLDDDKP